MSFIPSLSEQEARHKRWEYLRAREAYEMTAHPFRVHMGRLHALYANPVMIVSEGRVIETRYNWDAKGKELYDKCAEWLKFLQDRFNAEIGA